MRESITQEFDYGCGIACYAFALGISYKKAAKQLGEQQAQSNRFWVKDLREALNKSGLSYISRHCKPRQDNLEYSEGTIVLIRRSKIYPTGHYLIRHNNQWMDPWVNSPSNNDIRMAKSGYRKELPGIPMYIILPTQP